MKTEITNLKILKKLLQEIEKKLDECYVVGGLLRDFLLNRNFTLDKIDVIDIDIAAKNVDPEVLKKIFLKYKLPYIILDENNKVYRTVIKDNQQLINIDISNYTNLIDDVYRRDFTINTLYLKLDHFLLFLEKKDRKIIYSNFVDKLDAKKDIKKKVIKIVSPRSFVEDPVRILRAVRFMTYGFKIDSSTEEFIKKDRMLLQRVANERIKEELKKIFNCPSYHILEWMDKNKILEVIFPELEIAKVKGKNTQFKKFYFHPEGLWQHIKLTYKYVEVVLSKLNCYFGKYYNEIGKHTSGKEYLIKLTALFHDIAKPLVVSKENGRVRFFHHEVKSADIAFRVFKRLKFSNEEIKVIISLIKNHMRLGSLFNNKDNLTDRAYLRLFREMGEDLYYLLVFCLADRLSYETIPVKERKKYNKDWGNINKFVKFENVILDKYLEYTKKISLPRLVTGNDIMEIFKIPEGPTVGKVLNFIREAQMLGKISTRNEALSLARQYIKTIKTGL